jgi:peptide deformylase
MPFSLRLSALAVILLIMLFLGLAEAGAGWSSAEKAVIKGDGVMRVLTIDDESDSLFLRTPSKDLTAKEIRSKEYSTLAERMLVTVTSPEQDGVGIAGPQVGIGRRIVAVQRFDKEGEPFEVYPNIRVTAKRGSPEPGPEGCLSVPGRRGDVLRWQDIDIAYTSPRTGRDTTETVKGFTAVIFQHETDHLDGILYIDKLVP